MREPASIRYKNPGAMWGNNRIAQKWGAAPKAVVLEDGKGQGNNIAVFPTYIQGICAQLDLWRSSPHYRNKTFQDAITIWSGHNEVPSYIAFCKKRVPGLTESTVMNDEFWRSPSGIAFLKAQAWHEAGKPYPASEADWVEAQRRVFAGDNRFQNKAPKPMKTSKIGNGSLVLGAGSAMEAASKAKDAIDQANAIKQSADDLGAGDVLAHLVTMPTFWIAVAMVVLCGFIWFWRREHAQAGV
ncbi:hypothetical protein ACRAVF_18905 [Bradyrhizobium oligotrophicum S58]